MRPKTIVLVVFILLVIIFLIQNRDVIQIEFLIFDWQISGSLFILVSVLLSFIVGFIVGRVTDNDDGQGKKPSANLNQSDTNIEPR